LAIRPIGQAIFKNKHQYDDYPKEIDEMRKALLPVLKNAKKHKIPAAFNVDKLIVNGKIYRGPETEKFPFYAKILSS